jgi:excisionase family DNA binding protein
MRLDEWNRWLDSQFVDEVEAAPPPPDPLAGNSEHAAPGAESPSFQARPVGDAPAPPPFVSVSGRAAGAGLRAAASPVSPAMEGEVPSLEEYIPFLKRRPEASHSAEPVEQSPADLEEGGAEAGPPADEPSHGFTPPPAPREDPAPLPRPAAARTEAAHPAAAQRTPPTRSRGEGAARPQITADTLWSLKPRHLDVLIAMGSDDVPQNSYTRDFKESRIELINRLLDPTLSLEDTARLLNVCPATIRRYTNRGLLSHHRTPGDQRRFKLSDVLAFLEAARDREPATAGGG